MKIRRVLFRSLLVFALLVAAIAAVLCVGVVVSRWTGSTPQFTDAAGRVLPRSIASLERIALGGYEQTVLIRGRSVDNPVLLFLHGGPGSSELSLVRHFNSALEDHFVVVLWDQRGTSKSYSPCIDSESMTVDRFIGDAGELVEILRRRFHRDRIYLVGHSWGSYLGLRLAREHPERFYAYVGIGQVVSMIDGERIGLRFVLDKARESRNRQALRELSAIKDYPSRRDGWMSDVFTQRKWLGKFGGVMYGKEGMESLFLVERSPEFTIFEFLPFFMGSIFSLRTMWPQLLEAGDFRKSAPALEVPVYLVTGRHDYNVPFELTADYYRILRAPRKRLVWFEHSGHMPNFEEPEQFNRFMVDTVLRETYRH
ncbi:MAG: alpha/beta hydrolase [Spirochaetes bacterium]|nr:alpha/beta hydrolase [Spirochaetota bacterium]